VVLLVNSLSSINEINFLVFNEGATASVYVGQPLDTIKTKLQTFPNHYKNLFDCIQKIYTQNGLRGFYAGTLPSLLANTTGFYLIKTICQFLLFN
jgi:solute carrier family 25 ornithine transporter 2/15